MQKREPSYYIFLKLLQKIFYAITSLFSSSLYPLKNI